MAASNYQRVWGLQVLHSYYPQSICTDIQLVPSEATAAVFKRYGFTMTASANQWLLYCNTPSSLPALLQYITQATGQDAFVLGLQSGTVDFTNFTDMPMQGNTGFDYNSNDTEAAGNNNNALVLRPTMVPAIRLPWLGSITLRFADLAAVVGTAAIQYQILFSARATQWQYYVVNRSGLPLGSAAIRGKQGIRFTDARPVDLATGDRALFFSSDEGLLPLSKVPQYRFDLVNDPGGQATAKVIVKGLPNPATSLIEAVTINGQAQAASPMYVYV